MEIIMTIAICLVIAIFTTIVAMLMFNFLKLDNTNAMNWILTITLSLSIIFIAIYLTGGSSLLEYLTEWIKK